MIRADAGDIRRSYDAAARRARGDADRAKTRDRIVSAAQELFIANGYRATSMAAIAAAAGVSSQTIYLAIGSKAAVLQSVSDRVILGGEAAAVADLGWVHRLAAEDDPHAQLRILVTELVSLAERAAPIWRVTQQAAAEEPELAAAWRRHEEGRLADQRALVGLVRGLAVSPERATDIIHGFLRPDLWQVFGIERGWTRDEVEELALDLLAHLLL
ncbi:helix-turn-helix domain-containing protein [Gordonia sp. VNK1]|jgi:AcrR family transcriptional regulator|uniref:TetR/AcrR family transcriptional regulator n=1 Tax=Gordonia oleivorans TaxID=3156618 RepID=UPI0032B396F0